LAEGEGCKREEGEEDEGEGARGEMHLGDILRLVCSGSNMVFVEEGGEFEILI